MQNLCDSLIFEILSHVSVTDRWLLQFVNKQFRAAVKPTLQVHDPQRLRVLDHVLENAVSAGSLATVRFLLDRPSCVWANAANKAASAGDLEMVRLVARRGGSAPQSALLAALAGGHLDVAKYLLAHTAVTIEAEALFYAAQSASTTVLEWTVSNMKGSIIDKTTMNSAFRTACIKGDLGCVEFLCNLFGKDAINAAVFKTEMNMVFSKSVEVLRFLRATFGYEMDMQISRFFRKHAPFHDDFFDHFLETLGVDKMTAFSRRGDVFAHAYLVRKGLNPEDLSTAAAANVRTTEELKALMDLYPDPRRWTDELSTARIRQILASSAPLQAMFASFIGGRIIVDFEIFCTQKDVFDALRAMGGRCTSVTLWRVVLETADVDHARAVWDAMDLQERTKFRNAAPPSFGNGPDLGMLRFVALELDALDRLRDLKHMYWAPNRFTLELARFLIEHRIKDPYWVLVQAILLGHLDVVTTIARRWCTCTDLWKCLEFHYRTDMFCVVSDAIVEKTRPSWRWLARTRLAMMQFRKNKMGF